MKIIRLESGIKSDLNSEEKIQSIEEAPFFYLDFEWDKTGLDPYNSAHFNSYLLAVQHYAKIFSSLKPKGVIFAYSDAVFSKQLVLSEKLESSFQEFLVGHPLQESTDLLFELFCANIFSEYLHRLASELPEEVIPYLFFKLSKQQDKGKLIQLLCKRRFEHFTLYFLEETLPIHDIRAEIGVSLPLDEKWDAETLKTMDKLLLTLSLQGSPYTCIPEELLNEYWEGIQDLIVLPSTISAVGKRMLSGFEAAGGILRSSEEFLKTSE